MNRDDLIKILDQYIELTHKNADNLKIAFITSILEETTDFKDFSEHSVTTSYLTKKSCDNLINYFRDNNIYIELYTDFEDFLKTYYSDKKNFNLIFESSPKGIAKGKDALIPAFCDTVGLPHIGPDAASNLRCCNKYQWYCMLKENHLPVPDTYIFTDKWNKRPSSKEKYLLKLNEECASIGLSENSVFENDLKQLTAAALELKEIYNEPVIAQKFISGYEVEVPVLINDKNTLVLPPVGLKYADKELLKDVFFNYDMIYDDGYEVYSFEDFNKTISDKVVNIAENVINLLNLKGFFRVDFRITENGEPYVIDINNDPTLNDDGSFMHSIKTLGFSNHQLIAIIVGNYLFNQSKTERR